jgi:hypothetical protein
MKPSEEFSYRSETGLSRSSSLASPNPAFARQSTVDKSLARDAGALAREQPVKPVMAALRGVYPKIRGKLCSHLQDYKALPRY